MEFLNQPQPNYNVSDVIFCVFVFILKMMDNFFDQLSKSRPPGDLKFEDCICTEL